MSHFDDAKNLVAHAKSKLPELEKAYQESLAEHTVKPALLIDIKNITENLRSALDYAAHGLFTKYGTSSKANPKIYFPYATLSQNQSAFKASNRIDICIPGLSTKRPDIVAQLESYQHYTDPTNKWLPLFM